MTNPRLEHAITLIPSFHEVDAMEVVWHGNYLKFFERAREALFLALDYGYAKMAQSGYAWPIIEVGVKYRRPARLEREIRVLARIVEWEFALKIEYQITEVETGKLLCEGFTKQMAYDLKKQEGCLGSPAVLLEKLGVEPV